MGEKTIIMGGAVLGAESNGWPAQVANQNPRRRRVLPGVKEKPWGREKGRPKVERWGPQTGGLCWGPLDSDRRVW